MHPQLLDLEGAAALLGTTPGTARRWATSGEVPASRVGGRWRFWAPSLLDRVAGAAAAASSPLPVGDGEPDVVTAGELADLLGLHPVTVTALARRNALPGRKIGGQWRAHWPTIRDRIAAGQPVVDAPA